MVVEAIDTGQETQDLIGVARANTLVSGVVGWVDLRPPMSWTPSLLYAWP